MCPDDINEEIALAEHKHHEECDKMDHIGCTWTCDDNNEENNDENINWGWLSYSEYFAKSVSAI